MYHPYLRGKQFELITVRETAETLANSGFVPIIEPVKESLGGLERTLKTVCAAKGQVIVIVNPYHGDHMEDGVGISSLLKNKFIGNPYVKAGILLKGDMSAEAAHACYEEHKELDVSFIHSGFTGAKALADLLGEKMSGQRHIFAEAHCSKLYRKHFEAASRVLLRDGFKRRRNADHPPVEVFSDLHITYTDEGMAGFGDYLIVGDEYSETGGPAYAVAIHLTFLDTDNDDEMYIYHFVSKTKDSPTDPAGKFGEALDKLITKLNSGNSKLLETSAIQEFRDLHTNGHFPGLGYVKKLSMIHHIETLADYLAG